MIRTRMILWMTLAMVFAAFSAPPCVAEQEPDTPPQRKSMFFEQNKAGLLVKYGQYDKATEQYEWLWDHMLEYDQSMSAVRLSFMVGEIQDLAEIHQPTLDLFTEKRNKIDPDIQQGLFTFESLRDWIGLNTIVGDDKHTADWVLSFGERVNGQELFERAGFMAEDILFDLGEFDLFIMLKPNLPNDAKIDITRQKEIDLILNRNARNPIERQDSHQRFFVARIATLYLVCVKAGRKDDADSITDELFATFDDELTTTTLIQIAIDNDTVLDEYLTWLGDLEQPSKNAIRLRNRVSEALDQQNED